MYYFNFLLYVSLVFLVWSGGFGSSQIPSVLQKHRPSYNTERDAIFLFFFLVTEAPALFRGNTAHTDLMKYKRLYFQDLTPDKHSIHLTALSFWEHFHTICYVSDDFMAFLNILLKIDNNNSKQNYAFLEMCSKFFLLWQFLWCLLFFFFFLIGPAQEVTYVEVINSCCRANQGYTLL